MSHQPTGNSVTAELLGCRVVSLRRLGAADNEAMLALHQDLTDSDRYFRFFTLNHVGLDELAEKITEHVRDRYSLGTFDSDRLINV
ncbi:hypothetical protein [Mycobacterium tilburgii]|uniref:hypothetical protein n=1 Tax=Mycobacterium tilburgii TaxID=44467 RepID=UPI001183DEA1|nr:hypothetical protein [Mycobacterium tilburgii]